MNVPRPLLPAGAPSGRARTMKTSASTLEQKCFSPVRRHSSPSWTGGGGVGADVAAALALGEEHPALPGEVGIEAPKPRDQLVADGLGPVTLDDVGGGSRHPEPAVNRGLGLVDDVGDRGAQHRRDGPAGVGLERRRSRCGRGPPWYRSRSSCGRPRRPRSPICRTGAAPGRACRSPPRAVRRPCRRGRRTGRRAPLRTCAPRHREGAGPAGRSGSGPSRTSRDRRPARALRSRGACVDPTTGGRTSVLHGILRTAN